MNCRFCNSPLSHRFLDLGYAPPSNAYLPQEALNKPETYYPLRLYVCDQCWLVQTEDYASAQELFNSEYAYFSSTSTSWSNHAAKYFEMIINRLELNEDKLVAEIACNDGYLLKNFVTHGIPCFGVEPTESTAQAAIDAGIDVVIDFFSEELGSQLASDGRKADLIVGNNVLAHVPDVNDFVRGLKALLKPGGTITLEFPHLLRLLDGVQFDTVYHEHFSYFSLDTVCKIFSIAQLKVWDVEELSTHGGSLRIYVCHAEDAPKVSRSITDLLECEKDRGLRSIDTYYSFQKKVNRIKDEFLSFLIEKKDSGQSVAAYGAAAKGNTLLNFAGIKPDLLPFVFDASRSKQGKYLPGSHIPILEPELLVEHCPDYLLILPWNIVDELVVQLSHLQETGTKFVKAVPSLSFF